MSSKLDKKTCNEYENVGVTQMKRPEQKKNIKKSRTEIHKSQTKNSKSNTYAKFIFKIHLELSSLYANFK